MSETRKQPGAWPEGTLPALLEPFLYVVTADPEERWPGGPSVRVTGITRGPETVGNTGADLDGLIGGSHQGLIDGLARAAREVMYRQAEDAIAAALGAGWTLLEHPEIRMGGRVNRDAATGLDVPCAECQVDLHFRPPSQAASAGRPIRRAGA